ncbi:MAG TPA: potassium channel family protein [Candidatus Nanopelagicales bacterium]
MTQRRNDAPAEINPTRVSLPGRRLGPLGSILSRVLLAIACVVLTTLLVWLERADYHDSNGAGGPLTLIDALYYSTVTLSTTGYGDITPANEPARLVNALVITPLRFLFLITLIGTTIEVLTKRSREEFRDQRWRRHMRGHTVVVGFGVKGQSTVRGLLEAGTKASDIVVVDLSPENINAANAMGCAGIVGDATRQSTLERAKVADAERIVVAADRDDTAVLVTLTARRLSPTASIVASARENNNIDVLRQSGADTVIATAESAGRMLALSLTSPEAGSMIADLLEPIDGLEIIERAVAPAELGVDPGSLIKLGEVVLAVVRHGEAIRFDQGRVGLLQRDDQLVVVRAVGAANTVAAPR